MGAPIGTPDEHPDWLRWDGFEALDDAASAALALVEAGEHAAGRSAIAAVFDRAVAAPRRADGWLLGLAGAYERILGTTAADVDEAIAVFRRAEHALAPLTAEDRARALRLRTRFVADVCDDEELGPAALVSTLRFADETLGSARDADGPEAPVLRATLERLRIALGIRARAYPSRQHVYDAFDDGARRLADEELADLVGQRVALLGEAADFAAAQDEPAIEAAYLEQAEAEAARAPRDDAVAMLWPIRSRRVVMGLVHGPVDDVLPDLLAFADEPTPDVVARVANHGIMARAVGARLRADGRVDDARALEDRLLLRFVGADDPEVRAAAVRELRWGAGDDADGVAYGQRERDALRRAVAAFEGDGDPLVAAEVDSTMLRWATAEAHLGAFRPALAALDALAPRLAARAAVGDDVRWPQARALLVAHFAHAGVGDRAAALHALATVTAQTAQHDADPQIRAVRAQAGYWRSRLLREHGDAAGSRAVGRSVVEEFGHDPADEARLWASATLFSQWQAPRVRADERRAALARHGELFAADANPQIRARDVRRRIGQAVDLRDGGDVPGALQTLDALAGDHGGVRAVGVDAEPKHPEVEAALQRARDLRTVLAAVVDGGRPGEQQPHRDGVGMAAVDAATAEGNAVLATDPYAACAAYTRAADLAATATDPYARFAGVVALDNLTATLLDARDVPALLAAAERMVRTCDDVAALPLPDVLVQRVVGERATGLFRWAVALGKVGDVTRALHMYTLVADAVTADRVGDEDHVTAVSQAMYNRAVLLDDRGDLEAAVDAYAALAAAHRHWSDSAPRRVRLVKAHRNRGAVLERLGRIADAADDYASAVDLARGHAHPELRSRIVDSLVRFADLAVRCGTAATAVERLDWALGGGVSLDAAELRRLRALRGAAVRAARRR